MKALILSAGLGTRLRPLTEVPPKPLLPILNRPVLEHTLAMLERNGIQDVALNLHHLPDKIISHFGPALQYFREEEILGTAGAIRNCRNFLGGETFIVINGDIVSDIDLQKALAFHREKRSQVTLVVREDENPERYEPIEIDSGGKIVRFPHSEFRNPVAGTTRVMFTGAQIVEPDIFERIPPDRFCGTTDEVYPAMLNEAAPIYGYLHRGYWRDMGNREDYLLANEDALDEKIRLKGSGELNPEAHNVMHPVIIGKNCVLSPYSQIGPYAVLGDNCQVGEGALVESSVCWNNVVVGTGAVVRESVLGQNIIVPPKQKLFQRMGVQTGFKPILSSKE